MKRTWFVAIAGMAMAMALAVSASAQGGNSARREQARALTTAGNAAEALKIYDDLTGTRSTDVSLYMEATRAATGAHDFRRAAVYTERLVAVDPGNYGARVFVPLAYRLAGDESEALRARKEFAAYWKGSADPQVRSKPFLTIDTFRAGNWSVNVIQCLEIGGDFGVGYIFDVWGPKAPPMPPEELAANHRERIVLEHNQLDQKIASEMAHHEVPIRPTLDALSGTGHSTLKWFDGEPSYAVIRDIVGPYIANDKALATQTPMGNNWGRITCQTAGN